MSVTEQYKENLRQVIRELRRELRRPGEDLLPYSELARLVNEHSTPHMKRFGGISAQSLQQWSPENKPQRKMKEQIKSDSAQRIGVFLGCPPDSAGKWFQHWLEDRPVGDFRKSVRQDFFEFIESRPVRDAIAKPPLESISPLDMSNQLREISAQIQRLAEAFDRVFAQTPPSLQELLWKELKRAKQQGKLVANIDNPRAVAREFSKCCLEYDPDRLYEILSGSLVEIDLELCEISLFAHGLSLLLNEQWEQKTIQELLKGNEKARPIQKLPQSDELVNGKSLT